MKCNYSYKIDSIIQLSGDIWQLLHLYVFCELRNNDFLATVTSLVCNNSKVLFSRAVLNFEWFLLYIFAITVYLCTFHTAYLYSKIWFYSSLWQIFFMNLLLYFYFYWWIQLVSFINLTLKKNVRENLQNDQSEEAYII